MKKKIIAIVLASVLVVINSSVGYGDITSVNEPSNSESQDVNATYDLTGTSYSYNVTITWGDLNFTYTPTNKNWNPSTHTYGDAGEGSWGLTNAEPTNNDSIKVINHSNTSIKTHFEINDTASLPGDDVSVKIKEKDTDNVVCDASKTGVTKTDTSGRTLQSAVGLGTSDVSLIREGIVSIHGKPSTVFTTGKIASIKVIVTSP